MKKFLEIMGKDILKEEFTNREYLIYGIIAPAIMFILMAFAGWMDQMSGLQ